MEGLLSTGPTPSSLLTSIECQHVANQNMLQHDKPVMLRPIWSVIMSLIFDIARYINEKIPYIFFCNI